MKAPALALSTFLGMVYMLYHYPPNTMPPWAQLLFTGLIIVCVGASVITLVVTLEPEDAD